MFLSLDQFPEFRALQQRCEGLQQEITQVRALLPAYVPEEEARRMTGLSGTTLWRERRRKGSLIEWKQDHGVRYLRASLLAYNAKRAVGR